MLIEHAYGAVSRRIAEFRRCQAGEHTTCSQKRTVAGEGSKGIGKRKKRTVYGYGPYGIGIIG